MSDREMSTNDAGLSRRGFLAGTARVACGAGTAGLLLGLYGALAGSRPAYALRPPGALADDAFLGACVRCGLCVRDCPYDVLRLAELGAPIATGTPYFVAREVACEMCDDIPCVAACPTGALDPGLTDIDDARMGVAVLVGHETCLNYLGLRCDVCYRVCPLLDKAITLEPRLDRGVSRYALFIPTVHTEHCTGCGKCENACVLEEAAIKVLPLSLGKAGSGRVAGLGPGAGAPAPGPSLPGSPAFRGGPPGGAP